MNNSTNASAITRQLVTAASALLKERAEEVNRLNVFPVPDGDTGTNMSLTMDTVVRDLGGLEPTASLADACKAISHGSLMGARGNSGVILSQILRGLTEGVDGATQIDSELLATAMERAVTVAFQAVRKPVEGTMLTVIKDAAAASTDAFERGLSIEEALQFTRDAAFESVRNTPELLPVLKENGVVDAGGYGLAILIEGFTAAALGHTAVVSEVASESAPLMQVEPVNDWDDDEYLYCTEFLLFGPNVDRDNFHAYVSSAGGSELVVGSDGEYKVHVHTNDPAAVLAQATSLGEVAEVHINNMRRQTASRDERLRAEDTAGPAKERKAIGVVAVSAGEGLSAVLRSLGVDEIVSGGQTMNPSTEDLLQAIKRVNADAVLLLPNNKNILMAANAAAGVAEVPVRVVTTRSVPAAFSALLTFDPSGDLDELADGMSAAAADVHVGEVTVAVKNAKSKGGDIVAGQIIGILDDDEIEVVGEDVDQVAFDLALLISSDAETLTLFAGEGYDDARIEALAARISTALPDTEIETHRGEQPLYPVIMSAE